MSVILHEAPRWRAVVSEQFRMAGLRSWAAGVVLAAVLCVVAAGALRMAWSAAEMNRLHHLRENVNFTFSPQISVLLVALGLLFPLMLWQDEDPTRRLYHWAMPVSQPLHAFARVLAGWLWLMIVVALFLAGMLVLKGIAERMTGMPQRYDAGFTWWLWLVPFTSVTVGYAFASVAGIATRRPFVWIFGLPLLFSTAAALLRVMDTPFSRTVARAIGKVGTGTYGASAAIAGTVDVDLPSAFGQPSLSRWLGATSLWLLVALILLHFFARRRVEVSS